MTLRIATLNLGQTEKRWSERRELIMDQLGNLRPDIFVLNEISVTFDSARWIQRMAKEWLGIDYILAQQTRTDTGAEGILARYPLIGTDNLQLRTGKSAVLVAGLDIQGTHLDLYVTHLYRSRGEDSVREKQVRELLDWIASREATEFKIVCGDFNATVEQPSTKLMTEAFRPTQSEPTAFTPLREADSSPSHPYWERLDRCIDFIWIPDSVQMLRSGICFNKPAVNDLTLWPSDHVGVWADLKLSHS